jgi:hypothetical protein
MIFAVFCFTVAQAQHELFMLHALLLYQISFLDNVTHKRAHEISILKCYALDFFSFTVRALCHLTSFLFFHDFFANATQHLGLVENQLSFGKIGVCECVGLKTVASSPRTKHIHRFSRFSRPEMKCILCISSVYVVNYAVPYAAMVHFLWRYWVVFTFLCFIFFPFFFLHFCCIFVTRKNV